MRLCIIANPNSIHIHRWIRYFLARGHEVHLIGDKPLEAVLPAGVEYYDLTQLTNIRTARYVAWARLVRSLLRQIQPDLLHAHFVASAGWLGAASGFHPFVVTAWGSDLLVNARWSPAQRLLARWVLRQADYVTCVSRELVDVARSLGADPDRLQVLPWGVDTEVFYPADESARAELRSRLGLGPGPVVLSLRAIKSIYNPLDVARAMPLVLAQVPDAQFIIRTYGVVPGLLKDLQALIRELQIESAVHYMGDIGDDRAVANLYRAVDVTVSVPSSDGTPSSVLEALACGAPPVLSDLPSLRDWIVDEQEGLFVLTGNIAAIASSITRLLIDDELRAQLRSNGIRLVQEKADSNKLMGRYEDIYRRLKP